MELILAITGLEIIDKLEEKTENKRRKNEIQKRSKRAILRKR